MDGTVGLPALRVVDEQLRILAEQAVEHSTHSARAKRDVPIVNMPCARVPGDAAADAPGSLSAAGAPELAGISFHRSLRCARRFHQPGCALPDVHGDLGEEQVRPDAEAVAVMPVVSSTSRMVCASSLRRCSHKDSPSHRGRPRRWNRRRCLPVRYIFGKSHRCAYCIPAAIAARRRDHESTASRVAPQLENWCELPVSAPARRAGS